MTKDKWIDLDAGLWFSWRERRAWGHFYHSGCADPARQRGKLIPSVDIHGAWPTIINGLRCNHCKFRPDRFQWFIMCAFSVAVLEAS